MSVDALIAPYLPLTWQVVADLSIKNTLTFRNLLTHTSGLVDGGAKHSELLFQMWAGIDPTKARTTSMVEIGT